MLIILLSDKELVYNLQNVLKSKTRRIWDMVKGWTAVPGLAVNLNSNLKSWECVFWCSSECKLCWIRTLLSSDTDSSSSAPTHSLRTEPAWKLSDTARNRALKLGETLEHIYLSVLKKISRLCLWATHRQTNKLISKQTTTNRAQHALLSEHSTHYNLLEFTRTLGLVVYRGLGL